MKPTARTLTVSLALLLPAAAATAQTTTGGGATTTGSGTTSATNGSSTGGTSGACAPFTCASAQGLCGWIGDGCGALIECPCDGGLPPCTVAQPVPCSTPDGQFCCGRSQPYCCPHLACSADPACGAQATTGGSSTSGTSSTASSTASSAGGSGSISQAECPPDQPIACGATLCCTLAASTCCSQGDGGLVCSADPTCGGPRGRHLVMTPVGCVCGSGGTVGAASALLFGLGLLALRRRRAR